MLDHSESEGGDPRGPGASSTRSARSATSCRSSEHVISMEPIDGDDVITLDELREQRPRPLRRGLRAAHRRGRALRRRHLHLHVRHHRPAQGLRHRPRELARHARHGRRTQDVLVENEVAYLFLPLAHAFARLIQLGSIDVGATIAYWETDPQKIIPNLMEVKPTYFPSVPRIFEKIYAMAIVERARQGAARAGRRARDEGARDAGARRDGPGRSCRRRSTRPTRRCSRTSATSSAATSSRPSPAPRRSRRRSSSSSTPAACSCSRAGA